MSRRSMVIAPATTFALLVAGCGSDGDEPGAAQPEPGAPVTSAATAGGDTLTCATTEFSSRRLAARQPATALGTTGAQALADPDVTGLGDLTRWFVVEDSPKKVVIVRPLAKPKKGARPRTHEVVQIEMLDRAGPRGWSVTARATCTPRLK